MKNRPKTLLLSIWTVFFAAAGWCPAAVTITVSGTLTSGPGPLVAGEPFEVTFSISPGTEAHWTAGTEFSPAAWNNDYSLDSQVVSSLSSPAILNGSVPGTSADMPFASLHAWDFSPVSFSMGAMLELFVADLGDGWSLRTVNFETTDLPLAYPGSYVDPASYLSSIAGTYDSGLDNTFLFLSAWNGLTSGATVAVNEIVIVPEPAPIAMAAVLGMVCIFGVYRRRRTHRNLPLGVP